MTKMIEAEPISNPDFEFQDYRPLSLAQSKQVQSAATGNYSGYANW
jgi:hypothetical protein